jgi:hypothetical protein
MSMTEPVTAPAKPKKKRKAAKRAVPKAAKSEAAAVAFPGLTESACAAACSVNGCVISGNSVCGHPRKGGLQSYNAAALGRLQQAKKQLGMDALGKRFS